MMIIDFLNWDSDFFGLKIATTSVKPTDEEKDVVKKIQSNKNQYDLLYINTPGDYFLSENVLDNNIKLVDSKVIYAKSVNNDLETSLTNQVTVYSEKETHPDLVSLSLQSGACSRFRTDTNFKPGTFERFYTRWIENSVNGSIADAILVYRECDRIKGMVTVSYNENTEVVKIGLTAVDKSAQNQGIGKHLMQAVERYAIQRSAKNIEVATQLDNKRACSFYEKCHFSVKLITNIYHYWTK